MSLDDLDKALAGGGARSAFNKTSPIGASVTGTVIDATVRQMIDFVTKQPDTWDDGNPKNQVAIRIQTTLREDADDDGVRGVYVKLWGVHKEALVDAIRAAGGTKASDVLLPGATFTSTFVGTQPSGAGDDTKLYRHQIVPPSVAGLDAATATAPAQPVAQPAPPQQATPAAPPAAPAGPAPADTARQLLGAGLDDNTIANATGLSFEAVAALRNALQPTA